MRRCWDFDKPMRLLDHLSFIRFCWHFLSVYLHKRKLPENFHLILPNLSVKTVKTIWGDFFHPNNWSHAIEFNGTYWSRPAGSQHYHGPRRSSGVGKAKQLNRYLLPPWWDELLTSTRTSRLVTWFFRTSQKPQVRRDSSLSGPGTLGFSSVQRRKQWPSH